MNILVIGAGVSGLTSALRLLEAGHSVRIWSREQPQQTTSAVAGAIWHPYQVEESDHVLHWAGVTFHELVRLAGDPATGVVMRDGFQLFRRQPEIHHRWTEIIPEFRRATQAELRDGYVYGYAMRLPLVDMPIYLEWLRRRFERSGGTIDTRSITVTDLSSLHGEADVVINCTGIGARKITEVNEIEMTLPPGERLHGARGQIHIVDAPYVSTFFIGEGDSDDPTTSTYIFPRTSSVVLGGTLERDVEERICTENTLASIRRRCAEWTPQLEAAPPGQSHVGIRPCRAKVRLEFEKLDGVNVVHNYGHGGAGVTLSWGCAERVVELVEENRG